MSALAEIDAEYAKLATLTGLTQQKWQDILTLPADAQALVLRGYADMDWVKVPDRLAEVLAVLNVVGVILGVVSGGAGAVSAVAALRVL